MGTAGVSVKAGVGVSVGGKGVGVTAPAVWVSMTDANCAAVVPIISAVGVAAACGAHDAEIVAMNIASKTVQIKSNFILLQ